MLVHKLKTEHNIATNLYLIGSIESEAIYQTLLRSVKELNIEDMVTFSKKSIRYSEMSDEVKKGYFLNYSVGFFLGYSSLECMQNNLKTIFYNIDPHYSHSIKDKYSCYCADLDSLVNLVKAISLNKTETDNTLVVENQRLLAQFMLQNNEAAFLKSILLGESPGSVIK
jgi:hypothetical protein